MNSLIRSVLALFFLLQMSAGSAQMQSNMTLLSSWTDTTLPVGWTTGAFNDCWGYVDSAGREYAIIGSTLGTHIFDITDAVNPALVSFQPGMESSSNAVHRDFKTHQHYLYAVCDEGNSSLQIFDMKYLPDSVHKVYDSQSICKTAHNIFIDNGRLYFAGLNDGVNPIIFRVASLANPENPVVINDLASPPFGYVHDVCVRKDTAFLSAGGSGLFIYDYTNPNSPILIGSITNYPEQGYNHSSWVSDDGKTLVFADETHAKGLKVYDISDLSNITLKSIFQSNLLNDTSNGGKGQSIPHNPFIVRNNKVFISYYHDGVQCYDISNISSPFQAGYYDTHPQNADYNGYGPGCWGTYPFLPSSHIIGSDIANGLFILDGTQILGVNDEFQSKSDVLVFPNPSSNMLSVNCTQPNIGEITLEIYDALGNKILMLPSYASGSPVNVSSLKTGLYLMKVIGNGSELTKKIIKTN